MTDIRPCAEADLAGITAVYDHYIRTGPITFDIDPWTPEQRLAWFGHYGLDGPHRCLVAADGSGVLGYATSSPFRPKQAYATSVESSVYLRPDACGRGLGRALYSELFEALEGEDVHRAYAGVTTGNPASEALHSAFGFVLVGVFTQVGRKHGRYWDVGWYEKPL